MRQFKNFYIILLIAFLLHSSAVGVFAEQSDDSYANATVTEGCHTIDAASAYLGTAKLSDNVGAAILYEVNSDTLMYAWNADDKVYPSSLVKMLTALIAVERGDPQSMVTVDQATLDSVPYFAASAELQAGEEISLSELLYAMLVGSANDAAAVIATHISGSIDVFVNEMNAYAQQLGCTGTQFTNVHGLHDENQYTTARDLARILTAAIKNEAFLTYFKEIKHIIPATNMWQERELSSGNFLMNTEKMPLYFDARAIGGRTGTAEDGSRCLATLAEHKGMQVVCIVMGSESTFAEDGNTLTYGSFKETSVLLDACFTGYQVAQILYEGQVLKQCGVLNGENDVVLSSNQSVYSVLPEGVSIADLSFQYDDQAMEIAAPIEAGQVLSKVQVWYGGLCVAQADLSAMNSVRKLEVNTERIDDDNSGVRTAFIIIAVVIGVAVALLLLLRGMRMLHIFKRSMRGKRYMHSRRRSR